MTPILAPSLSHRFRVRFENEARPKNNYERLSAQVTRAEYDLSNETAVITLEEPCAESDFMSEINDICSNIGNLNIYIDDLNGDGTVSKSLVLHRQNRWENVATDSGLMVRSPKGFKHQCVRDYANTGAVHHVLSITFDSITVLNVRPEAAQ